MDAVIARPGPVRGDAPPVPKAPVRVPMRIPEPRRPVDDAAWTLEHHPGAAGRARRIVHATLDGWGVAHGAADAVVLVVCELVTNAVEHAQAPLTLHLHRDTDQRVWVGVSDGGPAAREGAWTTSCAPDEHGRGLAIVDALASRHGCRTHPSGSIHWARMTLV